MPAPAKVLLGLLIVLAVSLVGFGVWVILDLTAHLDSVAVMD